MLLENDFTIDAPVEKAWAALNNPETVAPCFPGATLTSYEGDGFVGTVKVKLGPISMTYKGKGTYVSRDEAAHEVVIDATGRDSRGNGTASAKVTATLAADGPDRTAVSLVTDMTITGKPAQFGRGVIADVADKIIGQFSACVAHKLAGPAEAAEPATEPAAAASSGAVPAGAGSNGAVPGGAAAGAGQADEAVEEGAEALGTARTSAGQPPPSTDPGPSAATADAATAGAAALGTSAAGTPAADTSAAGTSAAGTSAAGTSGAGTSAADAARPGTPGATGPAAPVTGAGAAVPGESRAPAAAAPVRTTPRGPIASEVEAIDLLDTAGAPVLKRAAPVAVGALLLVLVILLVRRLRSG